MLKLFKYLKPYWLKILALFIVIGLQTWTTLQLPALMAKIVDYGIKNNDTGYIWYMGLHMLLSTVVAVACAVGASFLASKIGMGFSRDLRNDFFKKVVSFSVSDIEKFSTASLITRTTNDIQQVQQTITMMLQMLVRAPMMAIIAVIQAIRIAADMAWIIAAAVVIITVLVVLILSAVMPKFKLFQKLLDKITLLTRETLTGLRVIRAFNNDKIEHAKFARANTELTDTIIYINKIMSLENPLLILVFDGVTLLCIWVGIPHLEVDVNYVGNIIAFMQYATQVLTSFLVLTMLFMIFPRANISAERINAVLRAKNKILWKEKTAKTPAKTPSVEFRNVDFSYTHAEEKILSNISFTAKVGETTAFVGSTGSGKSTIVNLIPRFYEVTSGDVLVDEINIKDYAEKDLLNRIGYVPQRGLLFAGTVASNIKFGAPNISDEEMRKAAKVAQAHDFIEKLDKKYDSHISQGGTNVSGGQRQRLSIARAIAKKPEIYIFDDSFSALDMKTDKKLREALKNVTKKSVVLIVAQRISTIKDADQIVVLEKGKIVGKGKHYALLKNCKVYQDIVKSQLSEKEFKTELKLSERETKNA